MRGMVPLTEVHSDILSDRSIKMMHRWIQKCQRDHRCLQDGEFQLPSRVLDLGSEQSIDKARLRSANNGYGQYVALTYRWGSTPSKILTTASIEEWIQGIQVSSLSKTYQDAIVLAKRLGYRYIWIDALCILQNDPADWEREDAVMHKIYGNASLTISALSAWGSDVGFLGQRPYPVSEIGRFFQSYDERNDLYVRQAVAGLSVRNNLAERGWCLQEHLMAARVLHMTDVQTVFECSECMEWESGLKSFEIHGSTTGLSSHLKRDFFTHSGAGNEDSKGTVHHALRCWLRLVENFSRRKLTRENDKLHAIAGLARLAQPSADDVYVAGLWMNHLAGQLLWRPQDGSKFTADDCDMIAPETSRAPSWSWAALNGGVKFPDMHPQELGIDILSIGLIHSSVLRHGITSFAALSLIGNVLGLEVDSICGTRDRFEGWHEFYLGNRPSSSPNEQTQGDTLWLPSPRTPLNGRARLDTGQIPPVLRVWLIRLVARGTYSYHPHGLVLKAVETETDVYSRLGVFEPPEPDISYNGRSWFPPCSSKTITLM
jgi:Heterokaryon incompatibility protein (HET)